MRLVYSDKKFELYEYSPTLLKPLAIDFEKMRIARRIRFIKEWFGEKRFLVYYLKVDNKFVGHCVISPGGRRLKCSKKSDIVIGPYYICENERGKGYAEKLLSLSLKKCSYPYEYAYDWIDKDNGASNAVTISCGFERYAELNVTRWLRRLLIVENGQDIVYRYHNPVIQREK